MASFLNLTPHDVTMYAADGVTVVKTIPKAGVSVRVREEVAERTMLDGVPVVSKRFGEVTGLPAPIPDTWMIVSELVARAAPQRCDLLVPDTGPDGVVRDASTGAILGSKRFFQTCVAHG